MHRSGFSHDPSLQNVTWYRLFPFTIVSMLFLPLSLSHVISEPSIFMLCRAPWFFKPGLFSTWMFNQLMTAALISGSAMELSGGVRWWKSSLEYHNMIRVINAVWCNREGNLACSQCGMQIRCFWLMPLLQWLTCELNKSAPGVI